VSAFLSDEWFTTTNAAFDGVTAQSDETSALKPALVVLELEDGPNDKPHAITFQFKENHASVASGDHLMADTILRLSFDDAQALVEGTLSSADVLREGRLKVRGDVHAIVALAAWLAAVRDETAS
jgi:ubiquinone biosynthesis protein UbiJ